ncbi:hypothetical protein L6164_025065 [Bauhinia variegata]|uniref:Uncharacterized protein n=2 Tax=Bauhinia variegata TaxID=167791 RepID=A0ACB9M0T4_BAUVA|nr:hypothetical protein L6164_025065 [Bauhinia variegata]
MKTPDSKTVKPSRKSCIKTGLTGIKNPVKRINRSNQKARGDTSHANAPGCGEESLDKRTVQCSPFKDALVTGSLFPKRVTFVTEKGATHNLHPGEILVSSTKIKLQLFPINRDTRAGLEKDGHNPYLELTLRAQKKISSVLKHLEKKWGSSRIATGEPRLFPYNATENLSNCQRWTLNDDMTAGQVYAAVGNPAIFRLRYGWFSVHQPGLFGMPSTSIPFEAGAQSGGGAQGGQDTDIESLYDKDEKVEVTSKEYKAIDKGDATNAVVPKEIENVSVDKLDTEPRTSSSVGQPSILWDDSFTNISIGGLLSEASLQGKFGISDPKSYGSNAGMQPNQTICDSLDAFISAQLSHSQCSSQPTEDLRTSILDAEETCHAFPLQKFSFSGKDVQTLSGKASSGACRQGGSSNSSKLPNADKVNNQAGLPQDLASRKTETDILLSSRAYDDERSLGLTGIKWNDSLGPFDLGLPAQKLIGGDSKKKLYIKERDVWKPQGKCQWRESCPTERKPSCRDQ